jgi:hypothetical protein
MIMELLSVSPTAKAPASNFTGDVYVNPIYRGEGAVADDRQPRSVHSGRAFQLALPRNGPDPARHRWRRAGRHTERHVIRMRAGDTVHTPPGEEHWHGGTADNMMCHLAMLEGTESGDGTTWLEPVSDEQYAAANES